MSASVFAAPASRRSIFDVAPTLLAVSPAPVAAGLRGYRCAGDFEALRAAYRGTGGLAEGDDLVRLLEDRQCGDCVSLARLIASRAVFGFAWRGLFWVPMFQFDQRDLSTSITTRRIVEELTPPYDGWELAAWFIQPNSWLDGSRPLDRIGVNAGQVLKAASVERFVSTGYRSVPPPKPSSQPPAKPARRSPEIT